VGGDGGEDAPRPRLVAKELLHQPDIVRVGVRLVGKGHLGRLVVGPLDQPHRGPHLDEARHVVGAAVQVALDDDADVLVARPQPFEEVQRGLDVVKALHVDAHKAADLGGASHDAFQVLRRQGRPKIHAQLRQLERHARTEIVTGDALQQLEDLGGGVARLMLAGDVLAKVIEGGQEAIAVQRRDGLLRLLQRLAGNKAANHGPGGAKARRCLPQPCALGQGQKKVAHQGHGGYAFPNTAARSAMRMYMPFSICRK